MCRVGYRAHMFGAEIANKAVIAVSGVARGGHVPCTPVKASAPTPVRCAPSPSPTPLPAHWLWTSACLDRGTISHAYNNTNSLSNQSRFKFKSFLILLR